MSCDEYEAMQKFLETPVLLEKLLPYLDLGSTLTLDLRDIWDALSQEGRWMVEDLYPAEMLQKIQSAHC